MKISVLITTYERPDFLEKVLEGYSRQTRMPDEIVVADDGSGPATRAVIEEFSQKLSCDLKHAWREHSGIELSKLRNHGTRQITGDYIIYTDGDCIPGPNFVKDHERLAVKGWFVQGSRMFVSRPGNEYVRGDETSFQLLKMWMKKDLSNLHWAIRIPGLWIEKKHLRGTKSCNLGVFYEDVLEINGWNEDFKGYMRQDTEFCLRLKRAGVRRRDPLFSAVSFHMDHDKNVDPGQLERNNQLLEMAETAPIHTPRGLHQKEEATANTVEDPAQEAA